MTKISYKSSRGMFTGKFDLRMEGHAGFNPGNDIVCAALSSQFFSLANYLDAIGASSSVEYDPVTGFGHISCRGGIRARLAFEYCLYSFMMLADTYSDNICVVET